MHYTQNDKIRQATEGTIVVGVDIGSEKNYARAFKGNGIEITRKAFCFPNTLEGFKSFEEMVTKLTVPLAEKKIVVGVEPTGHYWFNFADYCQGEQMTMVTVAPQHVKHSKEMDDNTQRKDDRKDPRVIAKLVIEGRYCIPYRPKGVYAELRVAYNRRCEIVEAETRAKNRIRRWFDLYFPEYRTVYGSVAAITGMVTMICAGNIITVDVTIGKHNIINLDCTIGHDAVLGDFVTLYPSVNVSGCSTIGAETELGTGMQTIQGMKVGSQTIVEAGAVVIRDIPDRCVAVGSPAKPIKYMDSQHNQSESTS